MLHPTLAATPDLLELLAPARPARDRSCSLAERDEFGPLDGATGLFRTAGEPQALTAREDLGHALCAWVAREDLL